jgi:hypothetical protein
MNRKKTRLPSRSEVAEVLQRIREYQPSRGPFSYVDRGRAVTEAHQLYNESFRLSKIYPVDSVLSEACTEAHRLWFTAIDNAYPRGFGEDVQRLRAGDPSGMEAAVSFLEADPWFYRTGYIKSKLIRSIKATLLTPEYVKRLQKVVLVLVDKRDDRVFRAYCRLALKVDSLELREQLTQRLIHEDTNIQRRARWVLEALGEKFPQG